MILEDGLHPDVLRWNDVLLSMIETPRHATESGICAPEPEKQLPLLLVAEPIAEAACSDDGRDTNHRQPPDVVAGQKEFGRPVGLESRRMAM